MTPYPTMREDEGTENETDSSADNSVDEQSNPAPALRLRQLTISELFHPIA